jgi:hypothetical protein
LIRGIPNFQCIIKKRFSEGFIDVNEYQVYLAMELFKYDIFTCTPKCPIRAMANAFIGYNILIQSSQ